MMGMASPCILMHSKDGQVVVVMQQPVGAHEEKDLQPSNAVSAMARMVASPNIQDPCRAAWRGKEYLLEQGV